MSEIKISLFKPARNGKIGVKPFPTDFYTEMAKIKDGTHYPIIKKLREITDDIERREYKASKLEAFTISAICPTYREIKGAIPSGLMAIDLDPKNNPAVTDWGAVRDMIFEMPEIVAAFLSASGNGVAFVVKIEPKDFKDVFYSISDELADNFDLNIDPGCHDIVRLRFTSFDQDLKMRTDYDSIPVKYPSSVYLEKKNSKTESVIEWAGELGEADSDRVYNLAIKKATSKLGAFAPGNRHHFGVNVAGFCNRVGMSREFLESKYLTDYPPESGISVDKRLEPIRNVYKKYKHLFDTYKDTVAGRKLNNKIVGEVVNNYIHKGLKITPPELDAIAQKLEANIDRVQAVVERVVNEYSEEHNQEARKENEQYKQFWYIDEDDKIAISKRAFRDFLISKGVFRYEVEKKWVLIRIEKNVVTEIQKAHLNKIVFVYVESMKELEVWELLANRVSSVFSDDYLELVPTRKVDFYRDSKDSICVFYNNGIVTIKGTSITFTDWDRFDGYVWKQQILERSTELRKRDKNNISAFEKFLRNVTSNDESKFLAFCSAIGYLIHLYKHKGNLPAIILNDQEISDNPAGGTGKGLIVDAVGRYRKVESIDGKLFDFSDKFRYQNITLDTQVVFFDDTEPSFNFGKLFSTLTTTMEVEQKGGLKFKLPFSISPKIVISTNTAVKGEGSSHIRRKHELEIANYYNADFTPAIEFKKQLFDDFSADEWIACDNFIFEACAVYLEDGLIKQVLTNQPIKKLYAKISRELFEFLEEEYPAESFAPYRYDQKEALKKWKELYGDKLGAKMFYSHLEDYYKYYEAEYSRRKIGDNRFFLIEGIKKKPE